MKAGVVVGPLVVDMAAQNVALAVGSLCVRCAPRVGTLQQLAGLRHPTGPAAAHQLDQLRAEGTDPDEHLQRLREALVNEALRQRGERN